MNDNQEEKKMMEASNKKNLLLEKKRDDFISRLNEINEMIRNDQRYHYEFAKEARIIIKRLEQIETELQSPLGTNSNSNKS